MTEADVAAARKRAEDTAAEVERLERESLPTQAWEQEYTLAAAAAKAAERRAASTARIFGAQEKRRAERAVQVKAAVKETRQMATGLDASMDQVNAAIRELARSLATVVTTASAHNQLVAAGRARLLELSLSVSDDTGEHAEGATDRGAMLAGKLRAPAEPGDVVMSVVAGVFQRHNPRHPFAAMRLRVPAWRLEAAGVDLESGARADVPRVPDPLRIERASLQAPPAGLALSHPDWKPLTAARRRAS